MSVVCPSGHRSETVDYCDHCGARIATGGPGAGAGPDATTVLPVIEELDTSPSSRREPCPACGAERSGDARYCEGCGYDFVSPPSAVVWEAVIVADRAQFDRHAVPGVAFPLDYGERRFRLSEGVNRVGRAREHGGGDTPEIDLAGSPVDPGISRLHAALEASGDGTCVLRDLGSTNGTELNDGLVAVAPHVAVPLADGDRIHVGVWTAITVHRRSASEVVRREQP